MSPDQHPCYLVATPKQVLHLGYPGSAASLAQQQGRAGRGTRPALSLLVAQDEALDQAVAQDAARLLAMPAEGCVLPSPPPPPRSSYCCCCCYYCYYYCCYYYCYYCYYCYYYYHHHHHQYYC